MKLIVKAALCMALLVPATTFAAPPKKPAPGPAKHMPAPKPAPHKPAPAPKPPMHFGSHNDVFSYLGGHTFYIGKDILRITNKAITLNGRPFATQPRITAMNKYTATIVAYPVSGPRKPMTFQINRNNGTIMHSSRTYRMR